LRNCTQVMHAMSQRAKELSAPMYDGQYCSNFKASNLYGKQGKYQIKARC